MTENGTAGTEVAPSAKRILHIHKLTGVGGSERHLQILLPRLDRQRFDVSLLLLTMPSRPIDEYVEFFRGVGIPVEQAVTRGDIDPGCLLEVYRRLRGRAFDLVHTHLIHADLYGGLAARLAGVPRIVSTRHNDDAFRRRAVLRFLARVTDWNCDRVITLSRYLADFTHRVEGVRANRIRTIPYGLELPDVRTSGDGVREEFGLPCGAPLVVTVGRLVRQKGHRYLLRAWPMVIAARPDARLLIVGKGPLRARLTEEAETLGVSDTVTFTGWRGDVAAILAAADVCAHPSLWEGFGLVLLEAMAAGTCIVASQVSTIPEIVLDRETGWLVPPQDSTSLAAAILRLLADPVRRRQLGEAGRRRAFETFSAERMARATEAVYEELLTPAGSPSRVGGEGARATPVASPPDGHG